jgi:hypothetical protein
MKEKKWLALEDLPAECRPLALAYSRVYDGLYHTNNVVRMAQGGPNAVLAIQNSGRILPERLLALQAAAGCLVEVEPTAPGYYVVWLWGGQKPGNRPVSGQWGFDGDPGMFRALPFSDAKTVIIEPLPAPDGA